MDRCLWCGHVKGDRCDCEERAACPRQGAPGHYDCGRCKHGVPLFAVRVFCGQCHPDAPTPVKVAPCA